MCGIAGYLDLSNKITDPDVMGHMLKKLEHRGPNNKDSWTENHISLGYTRLRILDLSNKGNQPFITNDTSGVLVYNGEVYNHKKLRKELRAECKEIAFHSSCDTETVLNALHFWGAEKAIRKFNGMFAFAYYDKRSENLWLGRDYAGIKPLYYSISQGHFVFGSEIKALFEHPSVNCRADMHALTTYILEKRLDRWAPFESISELEPGSLLKFSGGELTHHSYFDPVKDLDTARMVANNDYSCKYWVNEFETLFSDCVESHLASDAPVAVMCSGGVDSSLITAYSKIFDQNIVAYVADVDGQTPSEKDRAQRVCDHLDVELRVVHLAKTDFLRLWPLAVYFNDEPLFFKQNIAHMAVAEAVHNDGYKVLLCGEGADELFGGYRWQANTYRVWKTLLKRNRILSYLGPFAKYIHRFANNNSLTGLAKHYEEPFLSVEGIFNSKLEGRYVSAVDGGNRVLRSRDTFKKLAPLGKPEEQAFLTRAIEDFYVHLGTALKSNDKMNMAFSVESRVPFLDRRLIDFAAHLPFNMKYKNGISKPLLKKTASKLLPKDLMYVKKIGFGITHEMTKNTGTILHNGLIAEMFKWKKEYRAEITEIIKKDSLASFHFVSAELWARLFLNNESADDLTKILGNG